MSKREAQGAVASHRDAADGSAGATPANSVLAFNVGHEFLQEEVAVANGAVGGVDVEAAPTFGRDNQEVAHLVLAAQIVEQCPAARVEEGLLVVAKAVQKIEHWISLGRMVRRARVITGGQVDTVVDDLFENAAIEGAAVDAALRGRHA